MKRTITWRRICSYINLVNIIFQHCLWLVHINRMKLVSNWSAVGHLRTSSVVTVTLFGKPVPTSLTARIWKTYDVLGLKSSIKMSSSNKHANITLLLHSIMVFLAFLAPLLPAAGAAYSIGYVCLSSNFFKSLILQFFSNSHETCHICSMC